MHPAERMLEEAIALARKEEEALLSEDVETLEFLIAERLCLQEGAWSAREGYDEGAMQKQLLILYALQEKLEELCSQAIDQLRVQLGVTRKQAGYFSHYEDAHRHSHSAKLISKIS